MAANTLTVHRPAAITVQRDADVYRVAAIILSALDRLGVSNQHFSRIVVYGQRVVMFELPWLSYTHANALIEHHSFGVRLTCLIAPQIILLQRRAHGCALVIDLNSHSQSKEITP